MLRSPTYQRLMGHDDGYLEGEAGHIDLHAVAATEGVDAARRMVANVIMSKLAHVLHAVRKTSAGCDRLAKSGSIR